MSDQPQAGCRPEIRRITAAETWPLRQAILRPGQPVEAAQFPGDQAPATRHFGAFEAGHLLAIGSLFHAALPEKPGSPAFQLRGMATVPAARGRGLGRALALAGIAAARHAGVELVWCNARAPAVAFYRKLGFEVISPEFEIAGIGPHFRMTLALGPQV